MKPLVGTKEDAVTRPVRLACFANKSSKIVTPTPVVSNFLLLPKLS